MKSNTTNIIIAAIVVAGALYWYFFTGTGNQLPLTASSTENKAQTHFQTLVSALKPISFSTDIFSNPSFTSLVNLATPVTPETQGRIDPFAPLTSATVK
jgi:hypothetical protein